MASRGQPSSALATGPYVTVEPRCILARRPTAEIPVDPKSQHPHHPKSDSRTKRCRRGSEPIVYGEIGCPFAEVVALGQSEGVSFLRAKTRVRFLLQPRRRFLPLHNSPKIITKITNIISEMD